MNILENKTVFITGCNRGIGKAILEIFVQNGANIIAHCRTKTDDFERLCANLAEENGIKILPVYFDLLDSESMKNAIKTLMCNKTSVDILINNAGMISEPRLFQMTNIDDIKVSMDVNFFGPLQLTQLITKIMTRAKKGSIVNISSIAAIDGDPAQIDYVASKAAVIGATKKLAIELGPYGIRVNAIAPGLTNTEMASAMEQSMADRVVGQTILKRMAESKEIANAVLFLASDMSSYITGQVLRVDGGMI